MLASSTTVLGASHRFAGHTSQMEWFCQGSENYSGSDHQTVIMTFFVKTFCQTSQSLALGSALELLLSPTTELVVTGCIEYTFHCMS